MLKAFLTFAVLTLALFLFGCSSDNTRTKEFQVSMAPTVGGNGVTIFSVTKDWKDCKTTSSYVGNVVKGSGTLWFLAEVVCMENNQIIIKIGYLGTEAKQEYFSATIRVTEIVL